MARVDSMPVRHEPGFQNALSTMQRLKRAETRRNKKQWHKPLHPRLLGTGIQTGGSLIMNTHLKNGMTADDTEKPVF